MTIRERQEQQEKLLLAPWAARSAETAGRDIPVKPCDLRTEYQRDRDRIIHCKSFRRLKFKTQVFLSPEGDHYRTRLTHTLEVSQVARTLARSLRLNEDLTEAIALGHDLGHTPYGHIGERTLNDLLPEGFRHNEQSLRVVEVLENGGEGLNLTKEVRQGILSHSGKTEPATVEAECVRRADRIAYLNHDLDDALRAGILRPFELPEDCLNVLGHTHRERINTMINDIVTCSEDQPHLSMSAPVESAMDGLREFMFDRVYRDGWRDPEEARCDYVLRHLFDYYCEHPGEMPEEFVMIGYRDGTERSVCDFLSCMTDRYATRKFQELFVPSAFPAF
ncbi:deoxyguanosinetriphosphate triphosphohydrolase [Clostridiales bacterium FE2011]|nr:deoxyguanosinetriphosphate triphosphohydrolase [Clostridiales bacterium FE2011]QTE75414.1 deoxyguanosinetriphosphate triphosphohydrolase [Clostridiales bacterium FE2010]